MHDDRNEAYTIAHGCSIYILRLHVWTNLFMCSSKDLEAEDFRVLRSIFGLRLYFLCFKL